MNGPFTSYPAISCLYHGFNLPQISNDARLKGSLSNEIIPIYSIKNYKPVNFEKVRFLVNNFLKEIEAKYSEKLSNVNIFELLNYFIKSASGLMIHNPDNITVTITSSKSIFYKCNIDAYNVYLELFFDELTGKYAETAINVYKDKEIQLAISSPSINNIFNELEEILSFPGSYYSEIVEEQYELSGTPYTFSHL
jgi:hypothetical protein